MRPNAFLIVLLSCALFAGACGDDSPSPAAPSTTSNLNGNWAGDLVVQGTTAKMTWALSEPDGSSAVTGSVLIAEPNGFVLLNGALSGTFDGSKLSYSFVVGAGGIPSQPACTGQVSGTATETSGTPLTLNGTFAIVSSACPSPLQNGPFTLTKIP